MHQRHVFSAHDQIHYLGKPFSDEGVGRAFRDLACRDTANFDPTACEAILSASAKPSGHRSVSCVLLSDEIMLSPYAVDIDVLMGRLESVFGRLKVFVTIREQFDIFRSWCEHLLGKNEFGSLDTITDHQFKWRDTKGSIISFLDYHKYYLFLTERLGEDNVLMLPYELMLSQPGIYAGLLGRFLGVSGGSLLARFEAAPVENARGDRSHVAYLDFKKRLFLRRTPDAIDRAGAGIFGIVPYSQRHIDRRMDDLKGYFARKFAPGNVALRQALAGRYGIDIAELGYLLPSNSGEGAQASEGGGARSGPSYPPSNRD